MRYAKQGVIRDGNGTIITDATIAVYEAGTTTPASIYTAAAGGVAVNSVTSDSDTGEFVFYVDEADYATTTFFKIVVSKTSYTSQTWDNVVITNPTSVSDVAYAASWDGVTDIAPSKNAVYDKVATLAPLSGATLVLATINGLTPTSAATGWTMAGGTTSKTLTVSETLALTGYASSAEITAGAETDKIIAPDQLAAVNIRPIYEVDALYKYGSGTSFTKATIDAALTAIGTVNKTTLLLRPGTWTITADADYSTYTNVTWKPVAGAIIQVATTKTLTLAGTLDAGLYEIFDCVGTGKVVFKTGVIYNCHPVWFKGADYGLQVNAAIASIKDIGGKIVFSKSATVTTAINATGLTQGMVFEGCGASYDGETTNLMLTFQLSTVGFDCSGSNNIHFKDFCIDTNGVTYPKCGFLLARNAAGSGAGDHNFTNVKVNYTAKFSVAAVYSYGSEVNNHFGCVFVNNVAGKDVYYITAYNNASVTSPYITIATGAQSNSTFNFFGCSLYNKGGTNSNLFHLDSAQDFHVWGGLWYNQSAAAGGLAGVWIDDAHASSNMISIDGVRGETGTNEMSYWVYLDGSSASTNIDISITNCRIPVATYTVYGSNGSILYGFKYIGNYDANAKGISLDDFQYSTIELFGNPLVIGGTGTCNTIDYGVNGKVRTGQPAFLAYNSANDDNVTGDGTTVTVDFDTEVFDQGGDFATDTFTAPVTGKYQLNVSVYLNGLEAGDTMTISIVTSNRTYSVVKGFVVANETITWGGLVDMDAADTAFVQATVAGGDKNADIYGGANGYTSFSGHLVC